MYNVWILYNLRFDVSWPQMYSCELQVSLDGIYVCIAQRPNGLMSVCRYDTEILWLLALKHPKNKVDNVFLLFADVLVGNWIMNLSVNCLIGSGCVASLSFTLVSLTLVSFTLVSLTLVSLTLAFCCSATGQSSLGMSSMFKTWVQTFFLWDLFRSGFSGTALKWKKYSSGHLQFRSSCWMLNAWSIWCRYVLARSLGCISTWPRFVK